MAEPLAARTAGHVTERHRLSHLMARLTGRGHLQRLAVIEEKVVKLDRAPREELAAQRQAIDRLGALLPTRASASAVHEPHRRMEDLQRSFAHQVRRSQRRSNERGCSTSKGPMITASTGVSVNSCATTGPLSSGPGRKKSGSSCSIGCRSFAGS